MIEHFLNILVACGTRLQRRLFGHMHLRYPNPNPILGKRLKQTNSMFVDELIKIAPKMPSPSVSIAEQIELKLNSGELDAFSAQIHSLAICIEETILALRPLPLLRFAYSSSDFNDDYSHPEWAKFLLWCAKSGLKVEVVNCSYLPFPEEWGYDVTSMPEDYSTNQKFLKEEFALKLTPIISKS